MILIFGQTLIKYLDAEDPDILILTETKFALGKPDFSYLKTKFKVAFDEIDH